MKNYFYIQIIDSVKGHFLLMLFVLMVQNMIRSNNFTSNSLLFLINRKVARVKVIERSAWELKVLSMKYQFHLFE